MTKQRKAPPRKESTFATEEWPIDRLKPYENNPRNNARAVASLAESISTFGFRVPIVVDADGVIIAGHTRLKAARKLGLETVPVHVAADLSPAKAQALRLADNRVSEIAGWDADLLQAELDALVEQAEDDMDLAALMIDLDSMAKFLPADPLKLMDDEEAERKWLEAQTGARRQTLDVRITCPVDMLGRVRDQVVALGTQDVRVFVK